MAPCFGNVFNGENKRSIDQSVTLIESLIIVQIEANSWSCVNDVTISNEKPDDALNWTSFLRWWIWRGTYGSSRKRNRIARSARRRAGGRRDATVVRISIDTVLSLSLSLSTCGVLGRRRDASPGTSRRRHSTSDVRRRRLRPSFERVALDLRRSPSHRICRRYRVSLGFFLFFLFVCLFFFL